MGKRIKESEKRKYSENSLSKERNFYYKSNYDGRPHEYKHDSNTARRRYHNSSNYIKSHGSEWDKRRNLREDNYNCPRQQYFNKEYNKNHFNRDKYENHHDRKYHQRDHDIVIELNDHSTSRQSHSYVRHNYRKSRSRSRRREYKPRPNYDTVKIRPSIDHFKQSKRKEQHYDNHYTKKDYRDNFNSSYFHYNQLQNNNSYFNKHGKRDRSNSNQCANRRLDKTKSFKIEKLYYSNHHENKKDIPSNYYSSQYLNKKSSPVKEERRHQEKKNIKKKSESYSSYSKNKKSSSSSSSSSSSDLGHFKYKVGDRIHNKYEIKEFLGDGTFGRVLECKNLHTDDEILAIKVIRPVKRYIESAEIEAEIIEDINKKDINAESHCVMMKEHFRFSDDENTYMALVFEKLSKSLYDFIKWNKFRGFPLKHIQSFARQIFEGIGFLHDNMGLTHTDLKPENILLKYDGYITLKNKDDWPKNVLLKESREKSQSPSTRPHSTDHKIYDAYHVPEKSTIKIIDFGGATYDNEKHSDIINTRQYRSPEVILGCCSWDSKSDVWSIACILVELYTGELFLPTHDNEEHLALIESICGPLPEWMTRKCRSEFSNLFYTEKSEKEIEEIGHRINFHKLKKRHSVEDAIRSLDTLDDLIHKDEVIFKDFLKTLFIADPKLRPSCSDCLKHEFLRKTIK